MKNNNDLFQQLQKTKELLSIHDGEVQLQNIPEFTSSELFQEFNGYEKIIFSLDMTVNQAIQKIADAMSNEIIEQEIERWLDKVCTGRKDRNIENGETVLEHKRKVKRAAEIYASAHPELDGEKLIYMADHHDDAEYDEEDYPPGKISKEEKFKRELAVMMRLKEKFGGEEGQKRLDSRLEFEAGETPEGIACQQLDKLDRAVQAIEYEKAGYDNVQNFYPYTMGKLTDPTFIKILEILLKKEYPTINAYMQYFTLLACDGNEEMFISRMEQILEKQR